MLHHSSWLADSFSTLGAIKHHPYGEILGEIFKAVWASSGDEQQVTGLDGAACLAVEKLSAALRDDVQFIARMGLLWIVSAGRVNFYLQTAVLKQGEETRASRGFQLFKRLG
jgi:hypothetical protein